MKLVSVFVTTTTVVVGVVAVVVSADAVTRTTTSAATRISQFLSPELLDASSSLLWQDKIPEEEEDIVPAAAYSVSVHRNGDFDACGSSVFSLALLEEALSSFVDVDDDEEVGAVVDMDKYQVESLLTEFLHRHLPENGCSSLDPEDFDRPGFLGFCDMGPNRTVPQPDSHLLVPVPSSSESSQSSESLPCRYYTREGVRITSLNQLVTIILQAPKTSSTSTCASSLSNDNNTTTNDDNDDTCNQTQETIIGARQLELYAVPAGRVFMFAPKYVGERFELPHVLDFNGNPLALEVISTNPRVFEIYNFFSDQEADQLIQKALVEQSETHKLHRSTTGTIGASVYQRRTSENAWDTSGTTSGRIKKRCLSALGFDQYYESHTDGLQVLRYNLTNAYTQHMDYLTDVAKEDYDYRSGGRGGNRFATILMYMSDLQEGWGGETCFPKGERNPGGGPISNDAITDKKQMIQYLRERGEIDMLTPGSWEEDMTGQCRTRLAVTPKKSRAVLFYSQFPNGKPDPASEHGACPVLQGTKWAANLWVWNAARREFDHAPLKSGAAHKNQPRSANTMQEVSAVFVNSGHDPRMERAALYWQDQLFGDLNPGQTVRVNTFVSHVWNIKDPKTGTVLHTWTMNHPSNEDQYFTI